MTLEESKKAFVEEFKPLLLKHFPTSENMAEELSRHVFSDLLEIVYTLIKIKIKKDNPNENKTL